jgi:hypothetical protein
MLEKRIKSIKIGISNKKTIKSCRNILIFYPFKAHQIEMLTYNWTNLAILNEFYQSCFALKCREKLLKNKKRS